MRRWLPAGLLLPAALPHTPGRNAGASSQRDAPLAATPQPALPPPPPGLLVLGSVRAGRSSVLALLLLLPPLQRTKAGAKLAVPRPVNLPSLKKVRPMGSQQQRQLMLPCSAAVLQQVPDSAHSSLCVPQENAAHEPLPSATGSSGWSSGAPAGEGAPADAHRSADGPGAGPASSLVEKASWAGQGRPAAPTGPSAWEQPRPLSLREFPSLAAAAAVASQPHGQRGSGPHPAPESGAWDEDERGRGPPGGGPDRGRSPRRDGPYGGEDGYGYGRPPPYYSRRGDFSPPPWEREHPHDRRRFEGEEPGHHGRYGREREPPHHERGPYGGWRDEPSARDWRHDRCAWGQRLMPRQGS